MKVFELVFPVLLALAFYSSFAAATDNDKNYSAGKNGMAKEIIHKFESIIKENEKKLHETPDLKIVRRKRPYFTKFPIEEKELARIGVGGDVSIEEEEAPREEGETDSDTETESMADVDLDSMAERADEAENVVVSEFTDPVASDASDLSDVETKVVDTAESSDAGESQVGEDDIELKGVEENVEGKSENGTETIPIPAGKKLTKEEKKELKKRQKEIKQKEKELKKKEKELKKKEKELKKKEELDKRGNKLGFIGAILNKNRRSDGADNSNNEKKRLKQEKQKQKQDEKKKQEKAKKAKTDKDSSSCFSMKKKDKAQPSPSEDKTLEERLNEQEVVSETVSEAASDAQDELSTIASENEIVENESSVSDVEEHPGSTDILVERPGDDINDLDSDYDDVQAKEKALAMNETDFRTERMSEEDLLQDNDSDYLDIDEQQGNQNKYKFTEESEDEISEERAVKPFEGLEVEGISEGEDDDISNPSEAPAPSDYSMDQEDQEEQEREWVSSQNQISGDDNVELSSNDLSDSQEMVEGLEDNVENFSTRLSKMEDTASREKKSSSFFGKIKSFFKGKKLSKGSGCKGSGCKGSGCKGSSCKGPSCMKRFSKKSGLKFSKDFVPRIYLLSRDVPKENLYRVPEISSSLRSESNRLVFAYQLIDGGLIPSSTLALSSKSFIVRRWGKNIQKKLTKLRQEFDNLKVRLSSMYHEGVLKGEFELFIEEMDDLTIMLYLLAKEFPRKSDFAKTAKDILRYPEVVYSPGERLISMFHKSNNFKLRKEKGISRVEQERSEEEKSAIKALRKRIKFIKKRLNSLAN